MDKTLLPVIAFLRKRPATNLATLEEVAEVCNIDLNAPFSYREVAELAARLALCPYVTTIRTDGERWAKYAASAFLLHSGRDHEEVLG